MIPPITIFAIGHDKKSPTQQLVENYIKRCRPAPRLKTHEAKGDTRRERAWLSQQLTHNTHYLVGLDMTGKSISSPQLATTIQQQANSRRGLTFLIGGSEGLGEELRSKADVLVSFGSITLPHLLARVVLLEQIYRAQCILSGHPYHK